MGPGIEAEAMTGFHATIELPDLVPCPVARASAEADAPVRSVARASPSTPEAPLVEEFSIDAGGATDLDAAQVGVELTTVASDEREAVYRFTRDPDRLCACEIVEREGSPVSSIRAVDGALLVGVRTPDLESLTATVDALGERFDRIRLKELVEIGEESSTDLALVDRARLTPRQRDVLETAHEMGYFEYPKRANAGDVARELGISGSTFAEHLAAAQSKLLEAILDGERPD